MSTTPVVPTPTLSQDITWIRGHIFAALLAVALIAGSIIGGMSLFEGLIEKHDARVAAAQLQKEGVDTVTQQSLLAQLAQDRTADAAREAQQTALITSLVAQMTAQHVQTAKQVTTDSTLDAQESATRLAAQAKAPDGAVTATNNLVTMTLPVTRVVVADLDELPQAQADVVNLQSQLGAQKILTSDAKVETADAQKIITADKTELVAAVQADNAACNVRVDQQVAKDRKRGLWISILSAIAGGFLGRAI